MIQYETGMLAESRSGHDCGRLYVIMQSDDEYVYLVDGVHRPVEKPKKKKKKHIQVIKRIPEILAEKQENGETFSNEEIKRAIKLYRM